MKYYFAVLTFIFGVSLVLSVAYADQKPDVPHERQVQKRQDKSSTCVLHKGKAKPVPKCADRKRTSDR